MDKKNTFDEHDLIDMMFESADIDAFKSLWEKDKDAKKWNGLLHMCYWERSYESYGGDEVYLENPPINEKKLKYIEELINFLEASGIEAVDDFPGIKTIIKE